MLMLCRYCVASVLLLFMLSACGSLPVEARKRFFWPPPPEEPKVEYVNFYAYDKDLQRGVDNRLREAILGKRRVEPLFIQPFSVAIGTRGRIYVTDFAKGTLQILDPKGHQLRELQTRTGGKLQKVVCDTRGDIWVLDSNRAMIEHFDENEKSLAILQMKGAVRVASFAVDRERNRLYVIDTPAHLIRIYTLDGEVVGQIGGPGESPGAFKFPTDIDLDADGNLFVLDTLNARIQVLQPDGSVLRIFGERGTERGSFGRPKGLSLDRNGHVFVTDVHYNKIVIFSTKGEYLLSVGGYQQFEPGKGVVPGGFHFPSSIATNANGEIWVADMFNAMIHNYQLLTPDYLRQYPLNPDELYLPTPGDLSSDVYGEDPLPATGTPITPHSVQ